MKENTNKSIKPAIRKMKQEREANQKNKVQRSILREMKRTA